MNTAEKRAHLRLLLADCPACCPEDEEHVPDDKLDAWISSHTPPLPMSGPRERFDPCELAGHRVCRLPRHHLGPCQRTGHVEALTVTIEAS